jgi:hypothetical protein
VGPLVSAGSLSLDQVGTILTSGEEASALIVPALSRASIYGAFSAVAPSRVFAILPGDPRLREVGIEVAPTEATDPPIEMALFDSLGNKIADSVPGPDPRAVSVNFALDPVSQASGVYVKIAAPSEVAASSTSPAPTILEGYVLQVTRGPDTGPSLPSPSQDLTPTVRLGDGSSAVAPVASQSTVERSGGADVVPAVENDATQAALGALPAVAGASAGLQSLPSPAVATGPLPQRAGAPMGGVLAEGDPVPQLDRHDPALVDLALIGLPEAVPMPGVGDADLEAIVAETEAGRRLTEGEGLVAIAGPGGFPLLAASLPGDRTGGAEGLIALLPQPVAGSPAAATPALADLPAATDAQPQRLPREPRIAPATVLSGLTVAMAMVFGLVLPETCRLMSTAEAPRFRLRFRFRRRADGV